MTFSGQVGYETRKKLEHFEDAAFNHLDPAFIFLFYRSMLDSSIIVLVCLYITQSHYHHCANLSEDIELIKRLSDIFCRVCE